MYLKDKFELTKSRENLFNNIMWNLYYDLEGNHPFPLACECNMFEISYHSSANNMDFEILTKEFKIFRIVWFLAIQFTWNEKVLFNISWTLLSHTCYRYAPNLKSFENIYARIYFQCFLLHSLWKIKQDKVNVRNTNWPFISALVNKRYPISLNFVFISTYTSKW